jgi:hypothetical protein
MEHPEESDQLPEEAPAEQVPDDDGGGSDADRHEPENPDVGREPASDPETATGNP